MLNGIYKAPRYFEYGVDVDPIIFRTSATVARFAKSIALVNSGWDPLAIEHMRRITFWASVLDKCVAGLILSVSFCSDFIEDSSPRRCLDRRLCIIHGSMRSASSGSFAWLRGSGTKRGCIFATAPGSQELNPVALLLQTAPLQPSTRAIQTVYRSGSGQQQLPRPFSAYSPKLLRSMRTVARRIGAVNRAGPRGRVRSVTLRCKPRTV
jgi:hypothetical protein